MADPDSALTGLAAVLGSGGIVGIITAITSYLSAARKGRHDDDEPSSAVAIHVGKDMTAGKWDEVATGHLGTIAAAIIRVAAVQELQAEQVFEGKNFGDRLNAKEVHVLRDMIKRDKL